MRFAMRAPLRALAIAGVLTATAGPVLAQSNTAALAKDAPPATVAARPAREVKKTLTEDRECWRDFNRCDRQNLCGVYFDSFGVALEFNDGTIAPFAHERRHLLSAHDCIIKAREALDHGDRGLAVQWIMAAKELSPSL